ncbi:hypothetical protein DL96DRAFT_1652205, partial [Flagelloscypha sp. PMI_526]
MSSLQWFGLTITVTTSPIGESVLSLLLTPKLRRLSLTLRAALVIPGRPRDPLPLLTYLKLGNHDYSTSRSSTHPVDLLSGSASWLCLDDVRKIELTPNGAQFPTFPLNNRLEEIVLYGLPTLDSFIPSLTRFSRLKRVRIAASLMDGLERLVESVSDSASSFTVSFSILDYTLLDWPPAA